MSPSIPLSRAAPWLTAVAVCGGLAFDAWLPRVGHSVANVFVLALFAIALKLATSHERRSLFVCVALATFGEVVLCFGWEIYSYRLGNLPWFVPPGHALVFATGQALAQRVGPRFVRGVFVVSLVGTLALAAAGFTVDVLWFVLVLVCWTHRAGRPLYAVMLPLALSVEILGTAVGSWRWHESIPYLPLTSFNPPLLAGSFYCMLDLLVLGVGRLWWARSRANRAEVAT
ncbi:MAG: hypothetical protein IPH13_16865 [Planctomycetes bacterium]|nr:hypothetical protein [Planctomycetota bacterium]MCC7172368.1 hypothetical protein [Planctomycetota bacterium]